jgi:hypothetical protein
MAQMKLLVLITLVTVLAVVPLCAQAPEVQRRAIVAAWNECGNSLTRENALIEDLTKSFQLNPPWAVTDAREPEKRAKLIDDIIVEHRRRIALLEKIKAEDGKPKDVK